MSKLEEAKKRYKNRNINKTDEKTTISKTTRSSQLENAKKRYAAKSIGLDTFQSDLSSMGKTIEGIYSGWQTPETMQNTKSSVESMQKRINAYQEYQKVYGGADLSEISNTYNTILGEWDDRAKTYGKYKDADSYTKAMKAAEESLKIEESKKTANLDDVQKEIDSLEDILNKATEYETKIQGLKNKKNNWNYRTRGLQTETGYDTDLKATKAEYSQFLKDSGYTNADEIKGLISEKKAYKNTAKIIQDTINLEKISEDADFDKYVAKGEALGNEKRDGWLVPDNQRKNTVAYLRNNPEAMETFEESAKGGGKTVNRLITQGSPEYKLAKYGTNDQVNTYYAYLGKGDEESAKKYLNAIEESLNITMGTDIASEKDGTAEKLMYGVTAGLDQFEQGTRNLFNFSDDYIPVSPTQYASGQIRESLDDVGFEFLGSSLGQGAYDLITTTTNMTPSILASTASNFLLPGSGAYVGATLMGASAAGNAYQEMLNMGYDKLQARTYSTLIGVSEAGLGAAFGGVSSLGGKLSGKTITAIANGVDNALGRFAITMGGKMASEGLEEAAQEILSPFFQNIALGYSKYNMSDVEWEQVAYSGVLGALSAGFLEGVGTGKSTFGENHKAKGIGANIRSNEKIGEMLDISSLTPQESIAYDLYTQYANKGINADNISDLQLGRLFLNTEAETRNTLGSKKTTLSQKEQAIETQSKLSEINAENALDKNTITEIGENIEVSKQYRDGLISEGLESAENTESHRLAVELQEKLKNGEDISSKDIERLVKANQNAIRQEEIANFTESMSKEDAELFLEQYDGKADVSEFANAFNLVKELSENNFSQDYILQHKGILTPSQVGAIYKSKVLNSDQALQTALNNLKKKHEGTDFIQGTFDDSVINYDNTAIEGKVNWNSLTTSQKRATVLLSAFSTEHGMNVKLISNGIELGINGAFKIQDNEILIDVYAGMDKVNGKDMADLIFPTLSHELVHWSENKAPEIYRKLDNYVFDTLKMTGMSEKDILQQRRDKMEKAHPGKHFTDAEVRAEVVARANEDMLTKSKEFKKFFESLSDTEKKTFIDKAKGILHELKEWLDNFLAKYKSSAWEAKTVAEFQDRIEGQIELYEQMLKSAIEANQALQKEGITGEALAKANTDVQLAIREEFVNEIDDWVKDGKPDGESFVLGSTGDVLQGLGAIESDIYMLSDKINEILSDHPEISIDEIKKIPQILDNPVMVLKSKKLKSRLIMFGSVKAKNGKPMLVVLDLRPHEKGFMLNDMQKVNSAYTKTETFNKTAEENGRDFVEKSEVLYLDKKRTTHLLSAIGFYMPITCNQSGFIGSISYEGDNVNIKGVDFSKVIQKNPVQNSDRDNLGNALTEGQAEYFKDSKMRDENGNLLVMYRGDMNEFTVFDRKKSKYGNLYGRGFYFTKVKGHAEQYGKATEYYLNIKNPLSPKQNNITKKQMLNFLKAIENDGEDYDLYNYGEEATAESVLNGVWGKGDFEMLQDINAGAIGDLVAAIELFNEVNGTTYDGIILPSETVTFNSAQSKLTSNENPTDNEDVRFSMRENVEETKELVAVHNMQVSELERTLDLGGLPMPSIAIIKAKRGHSEYGDVSLVFSKDTIDPQMSKDNKVYGGDAWTPVYPRIEYKPNKKVTNKINDKYYELSRKFGYDESRPLYSYVYEMEDILNNHKGETALLEDLYDDEKMMQLYLLDSGKDKVETVKKEIRTELSDAEVEMNEFFIRELGANVIDEIMWDGSGTPMSYRKEYLSKYEDSIRDAYKKLLSEEYKFTEEQVQNTLDSTKSANLLNMIRDAHKYRENGRETIRTEADYEATKKAIKDAAGEDYRAWVDSLFKGIEEKSGIRNNTDLFTNSGNRRSWEALHWENNLENVIKVMKSQDNGVAAFFSGQAIWGVSAKDYRSIEEIKADADRLQQLPEEEYNQIKEGFGERLSEIARSIMDKTERNHFIAVDNAMECIVDAIRHSKTKSGMFSYLKQFQHLTVTETNVADIVSLVADISNMPTEYFEAKPRRAVELNEIATAIIPDSTSESTKARLDSMGIKYLEYESGNEDARLNALNSLEEVKFSDRDSDRITIADAHTAQSIGGKSVNGLTSEERRQFDNLAKKYWREMGVKSPFFRAWFGDWRENDIAPVTIVTQKGSNRGIRKNKDTNWDIQVSGVVFNETQKHKSKQSRDAVPYLDYIDSIVENAILLDSYTIEKEKAKSENSIMMHSFYSVVDIGKGKEVLKLFVEELNDVNSDGTINRIYKLKMLVASARVQGNSLSPVTNTTSNIKSVADLFKFVKTFDKDFNPKPASVVVNKDGTPKIVYHGSPEFFTIFDTHKDTSSIIYDASFFTSDEFRAKAYADKNNTTGHLYKGYVDIKNPLIPSKVREQINLIPNNIKEKYRSEFDIEDMVSKTDYAIIDFAKYVARKENSTMATVLTKWGFDGYFNGNDYAIFESEQFKSVENANPTSDPDYRFSDRETETIYDKMGETDRLQKENEKLKADIDRLNERLKIEKQVTHGNYFNENQLNAVAGHLRKISNSTYSKENLISQLKDVYSYIVQSENLVWDNLFAKCYEVAQNILSEAKPVTETDDYAKSILRDIRSKRISLSEAQKQEARYIFGKNYRNSFMGKVMITNDGISLDTQWQEWSQLYPEYFDDSISEADQINALYDIYDDLKDVSEMVVEYDTEEQTRWLATEIYNQYWNVSPIRTTADKYDKKIKLLNFEHRKAMQELRTSYNERLDKKLKAQKTADRQRTKELVDALRERKDREIAEVKQHSKERMDKYKENAERKTVIQRITANALTLNKWLTKNSKDYHIHEAMKGPVVKLLNAIDFSSKRMIEKGVPTQNDASFAEAFSEVKSMLQDATNMVEGLEELYGHELAEDIQRLVKSTYNRVGDNNYIINAMTNEELQSLDKLVRYIKKVVSEVNKFHVLNHNQGAVDLANEFMEHGDKLGNLKKQHGKMGKFFEFRNRTPYYFFKSLGRVGEKVYEAFQDGWDKLAFNAKKVIDFTEETYTSKEVKEWSKETKTFKLPQFDGKERTFEMSIAQIMALHCVSKQEDAQRHLLLGGMTLKRINKKGHVVADYENINLTISDLQTILSSLTDRQKEVADKLQNFMNTVCSEWGNEISMARFGIKQFGIPDYFPIKVSEATVPGDNTKDVDNASLFRLLNMSFTKARNVNAEQSIEIGDIFDVFAQHASDMAKYNALALPVLDFNKFYSIHGKDMANKEFGVVKTLKSVFGDEANGYIRRFVRDLNGSQNVSRDVIGNTFFKNAKVAAVAANLRVVLLQPTAFYKASAVLDNKYLIKAGAYIKVEPIGMVKKLKKAIDNAEKYCGIVQWKSLGYYDTDISKGLTEKIKHAESFKDKAIDKSLKFAEIADKVTFGTLWVACEFEIRDTRKDLKVGSKDYYDAIAKRLRDVIYATQVVDSTMTRSDMMRSSDRLDKMYTTFGSEPTIAYNMLLDVVSQYANDQKEFGIKEAVKKNANKARKVVTAYVVTNAMAALVESAFDAFREDDDEEMDVAEFLKLYFKNFALDMSIGNKLPVIKEAYSVMQGYSSSRMDTQWMQYLQYALNSKKPEKRVKYMIQFMSQISGLPFYNAYRDTMATLNKLDIFSEEELGEMLEDFFE